MSKSRIEALLEALINDTDPPQKPMSRVEAYLHILCDKHDELSEEIADLKQNGTGTGNIGTDFGGVEITDGEPTKETTVMTLNPNAEEVHLYTVEEIDAKLQNLSSGGNGSNKTLLGEVVVTGHKKIQPLAIDYSTGIVTVDDCSFLPNGLVSYTKYRVCIRKNTDAFHPNNVIPSELYGGIGIEKISDNTLYLYKAGTKIESYAENTSIDVNTWYIEYSDVALTGISVDLSEIEYGNHLAIEVFSPCAEIKTGVGLTVNVTDKDSVKYLSHGATNGIRASNATGGDEYAFDSIRAFSANSTKGNSLPLRYMYDLKITEDFIYVEAKNIFTVSSSDDKLPTYSFGQKAFLMNNNGLKKFTVNQGNNYLMLAEGSYIKIWEVYD